MNWSKPPPGRRGYHHGNLRAALVAAALELIAEHGPRGFSLTEAARKAGVSPGAPYRHFRDRDDLMVEVAREGFQRFADTLSAAWDEGRPSPDRALERLGRAYLAFAAAEPALYATMFDTQGGPAGGWEQAPDLAREGDRAFGVIRGACETIHALLPARRAPPLMMALHLWATTHGIASLFARGPGRRPLPVPPQDLLEAAVLIYLSGLGWEPKAG